MNNKPKIPDAETRAKSVANMRKTCRELELVTLELDELIAMVEVDLCRQRKERFLNKYKRAPVEASVKG